MTKVSSPHFGFGHADEALTWCFRTGTKQVWISMETLVSVQDWRHRKIFPGLISLSRVQKRIAFTSWHLDGPNAHPGWVQLRSYHPNTEWKGETNKSLISPLAMRMPKSTSVRLGSNTGCSVPLRKDPFRAHISLHNSKTTWPSGRIACTTVGKPISHTMPHMSSETH